MSYAVGTQLPHHAGSLWEVAEAGLPGDGKTWQGNMILCQDDYTIRCIEPTGTELPGHCMRVHADYLHGDGWKLARR
jgi:hypothetical protein